VSSWDDARRRAAEEGGELAPAKEPESEAPPPPEGYLTVVDHFDFGMLEVPVAGVRLLIRQVTRLQALALVRDYGDRATVVAMNDRGQNLLERELQLEMRWRPKVVYGTKLLVMHAVRWNELRWYLVEYECDGDGCVP
jgi:hypothetical protein